MIIQNYLFIFKIIKATLISYGHILANYFILAKFHHSNQQIPKYDKCFHVSIWKGTFRSKCEYNFLKPLCTSYITRSHTNRPLPIVLSLVIKARLGALWHSDKAHFHMKGRASSLALMTRHNRNSDWLILAPWAFFSTGQQEVGAGLWNPVVWIQISLPKETKILGRFEISFCTNSTIGTAGELSFKCHTARFHPQTQKWNNLVQHKKQYHWKVLRKSFQLNCHTIGFYLTLL